MSQNFEIDFKDRVESFKRLSIEEILELMKMLNSDWVLKDKPSLWKTFKFKNYTEGLQFVIYAANLAEVVNHHPDLLLGYRHVDVEIWTHNVNGLSKADFALANHIDQLNSP